MLKYRKDLEAEYDKTLRAKRMKAYEKLWAATQPLAQYAREWVMTAEVLQQMAIALRTWYYEQGGLYLTRSSKKAYFDLQIRLAAKQQNTSLSDAEFEELRQLGSTLRGSLADDIGARRKLGVTETDNETRLIISSKR